MGPVLTQDSFYEPVKFIGGEVLDNEFPALTLGVEGHFGSQTFLQSLFKISPLCAVGGASDGFFADDGSLDELLCLANR